MSHFITEVCTGCGACVRKCPVDAIEGVANTRHTIRDTLCIDCGLCGNLCPQSAVLGPDGSPVPKTRLSRRSMPSVDVDLCTGCVLCADICPVDCISMEPLLGDEQFFPVAVIDLKRCIGCGLCELICIKEAVTIESLGHPATT